MISRAAQLAFRVLLASGLMWLATRNASWTDIAGAVKAGSLSWFGVCLGLVVIDRALMAWRWMALLRAVETPPCVPRHQIVRIFFVSTFVGTFLPGGIGGDAVRALSLSRLGAPTQLAVGSVAVDRLLGTVSVLLMAAGGSILVGRLIDGRLLAVSIVIAILGVAGTILLLFDSRILAGLVRWAGRRFPRVERLAQKFLTGIRQYGGHRGVLIGVLLASIGVQALRSAQAWCLGLAIGLTLGGGWYFALIPFGVLAFLLPLSVSGLGAGVASFVPLFALAGLPREEAFALGLLFWFLGVLGNLPGGILMVLGSNSSRSGLASSLHK